MSKPENKSKAEWSVSTDRSGACLHFLRPGRAEVAGDRQGWSATVWCSASALPIHSGKTLSVQVLSNSFSRLPFAPSLLTLLHSCSSAGDAVLLEYVVVPLCHAFPLFRCWIRDWFLLTKPSAVYHPQGRKSMPKGGEETSKSCLLADCSYREVNPRDYVVLFRILKSLQMFPFSMEKMMSQDTFVLWNGGQCSDPQTSTNKD